MKDVLVSGRPADLPGNTTGEGKARCIIRTMHRDWNLVEDPAGSRGYRCLLPIEEERLMGFSDGFTLVQGASDAERHGLLGNSFSVPVMQQILRRLAPLAAAATRGEKGAAVEALKLRREGTRGALKACSSCMSAACMCV
jgi:hypothetical protein